MTSGKVTASATSKEGIVEELKAILEDSGIDSSKLGIG